MRRLDWGARSSAAFYRSLESALEEPSGPVRMDPVRNPYTPGAGLRPPELAGREDELRRFSVVLERAARGRPERGTVLTGPRGAGKTALLNAFRSLAVQRMWGTGGFEARPGRSLRAPLAAALHGALRELAPRHRAPDRVEYVLGVLKSFARTGTAPGERRHPGIDAVAVRGRADSGDIGTDLAELFADAASIATDLGTGIALFIDEMQELGAEDLSALCTACHDLAQSGGPLLIVGAGLPQLPAALSAGRGYSERLFRYTGVDGLGRAEAYRALTAPAEPEGVGFRDEALEALYRLSGGHPYLLQAYAKAAWDAAEQSPITAEDVTAGAAEAEEELDAGFFGGRYRSAAPAERTVLHAMAGLGDGPVRTEELAAAAALRPAALAGARAALTEKGLIHESGPDSLAFSVPAFARFLRRTA
ncbi:ATP-binding protein [Nocardiopsis potens]